MSASQRVITRELKRWPDLLALHESAPQRYPALLESVAHGTPQGRFDILLAAPGECLQLDGDGRLTGPHASDGDGSFLGALDVWHGSLRREAGLTPVPFTGGWLLYLGYELAGEIEPSLRLHRPGGLPVAFALRCHAALVRDHARGEAWLVYEEATEGAEAIPRELAAAGSDVIDEGNALASALTEEAPERFLEAVAQARRYIHDGEVYQANLSREWRARLRPETTNGMLYRRLSRSNPGPFAGLLVWEGHAVLSSSPERLLRMRDGYAETRPIAGTRPRSQAAREDRALSRELLAHPKERAEHVMLIDLERNDLGRICIPGTVEVNELMVLESYAHVHHIVSNVRGRPRQDVCPGQAIRAMFPGGTITGCPKVRCMSIIDELEQSSRGAYTGSAGYLNRDGSMDLNILIRTLVRHGDEVSLRAGAGIVADSVPERELEETRAKARGMIAALQGRI